jgi:hypothetical protein
VQWFPPVIPAWQRQEDHEFKASLSCIVRPCSKRQKQRLGYGCGSVVEHLPGKGKALSSNPSTAENKV